MEVSIIARELLSKLCTRKVVSRSAPALPRADPKK